MSAIVVGCGSNRPAPAARDAAPTPVEHEDPPPPADPAPAAATERDPARAVAQLIDLWRARDADGLRLVATTPVPDGGRESAVERHTAALLLYDLDRAPALLYELFADRNLLLPPDEEFGGACGDDARCRKALDAWPVFELAEAGNPEAILAVLHASDHGDGAVGDVLCTELLQLASVQPRRLLGQIATLAEGDPREEACGRVAFCIGPDRGTPTEVKQRIARLAQGRVPPAVAKVRNRIVTQVRAELAAEQSD